VDLTDPEVIWESKLQIHLVLLANVLNFVLLLLAVHMFLWLELSVTSRVVKRLPVLSMEMLTVRG